MTRRSLHDGRDDGLTPLQSLDLQAVHSFADLVRAMGRTAFGGRSLGRALEVLEAMARDAKCFTVLTVSGAMTVAKQGQILADLIDRGVVDAVVATGALVTHGLTEAFGKTHYAAPSDAADADLYAKGYNRIYDTLEMEANLDDLEAIVAAVMDRQDAGTEWSSRTVCETIGQELDARDEGPGILRSAYRRGVPVYIPAFTDSELGLDLATWAMKSGAEAEDASGYLARVPSFNPFFDLQDYARRAMAAESLGILTIGGGVPRNWAQQVAPYLDVAGNRLGVDFGDVRFRYGVRICPEPVHWGGLSGCTYSEGVSWGKFVPESEGGMHAEVYADATLVLPLLMKALFEVMEDV